MKLLARFASWVRLRSPLVRYSTISVAVGLWGFGLVDQFYSSAATMKYVLMSLLIAAVAML